jgi:hypothetical protein
LDENSRYVHTRKPEVYCIILIIKSMRLGQAGHVVRIGVTRDLCSLFSIILIIKSKRLRQDRHVARMGDKRNAYIILVVKSLEKCLLGRPKEMGQRLGALWMELT